MRALLKGCHFHPLSFTSLRRCRGQGLGERCHLGGVMCYSLLVLGKGEGNSTTVVTKSLSFTTFQ